VKTAFLLHPAASLHDTGWGNPEHQGRLRALASTIGRDIITLNGEVEQIDPGEAELDDALRVHERSLLDRVREGAERAERTGTVYCLPDAHDVQLSGASWDAIMGSLGAALTAVAGVAEGRFRNAFVATRPPGHHATPDRAMGFCFVNHVAAAARWLQHHGHAERVLIVDWDVHHGNGTQDIFWEDSTVFFLSLHQSPHYPWTGAAHEVGGGPGEGYTRNVPLPAGLPREAWLKRYEAALDDAFGRFTPDFVLVSAGFDALAGDPLGGQLLDPSDFHGVTRSLMARADESCGGRVVALLEGGYDPPRTGRAAAALLRALAGVGAPDPIPGPGSG
jgi:acetoin utilization deacetylase AcuC-like enzyme